MVFYRFSEKTKYMTSRIVSCVLGLVTVEFIHNLTIFFYFQSPTICFLTFSIFRMLVYFGVCQESSEDWTCTFLAKYDLVDLGIEGGNRRKVFVMLRLFLWCIFWCVSSFDFIWLNLLAHWCQKLAPKLYPLCIMDIQF